jgi:hypothetical protein
MVKALSFFKRRAGMPVDEFQAYLRTAPSRAGTPKAGRRANRRQHDERAMKEQ